MAQLNITLSQEELLELVVGNREEALKHLLERIFNQALQAESAEQLKAEQYQRSSDRTDYRNGSRERELTTKIGTITLSVPRHRNEPFHTQLFETYQRSEVALLDTMAEMVVMGVSTRKVSKVLELVCGKSFSKSTVSEVCSRLDPEVEQFRNRRLDEHFYPFVMVDATYFKVREDHKIVSKCIMIAVGITDDGHREILYFSTYDGETNENWKDFFDHLKSNGLAAPLMITSDAHPSIRYAVSKVFPLTPWQRCQFHFTRNILDEVPAKEKEGFRLSLQKMFNCTTIQEARLQRDHIINDYEAIAEKAVHTLEEGFEDSMTIHQLPSTVRVPLRTSNAVERLNRELKRRSDVIQIFPNTESLLRLMGSVLMEMNDRIYSHKGLFSKTAFERITPQIRIELQKTAMEQSRLLQAA